MENLRFYRGFFQHRHVPRALAATERRTAVQQRRQNQTIPGTAYAFPEAGIISTIPESNLRGQSRAVLLYIQKESPTQSD